MKFNSLLPIALSTLSLSLLAAPVTIIDWGGDYTTGNLLRQNQGTTTNMQNLDGLGDLNDSRRYTAYSETTAMRNAGQGTNSRFYGGQDLYEFNKSVSGVPDQDEWEIENNGTADRILMRIQPSNSAYGETYGVYMWLAADFLASGNDELNSMSISVTNNAYTLRWMVKVGASDYYLSNQTITGSSKTVSLAAPGDTTWSAYSPGSSLKFTPGTFGALPTGSVTGVGVYYQQLNQPNSAQYMRITDFTVTAIPEPGTLVLVGVALLGVVLIRPRRK